MLVDSVHFGGERYPREDQLSVQSTPSNRINLDGIFKDILGRTILLSLATVMTVLRTKL